MPIFRITVITTKIANGQRIDKGLYVDIQTYSFANPIYNEKVLVKNALLYQRGVDLEKLGALNGGYLSAKRIG